MVVLPGCPSRHEPARSQGLLIPKDNIPTESHTRASSLGKLSVGIGNPRDRASSYRLGQQGRTSITQGHSASRPSKTVTAAARQTAPSRADPTEGQRAGDSRTRRLGTRGDHELETDDSESPTPTRAADRLCHHDSSNTGPTCRRLGPRRRIGRPSDLTRTTEKADSDDGSETGNRTDNMKSRSAGSKRQVATWQGAYKCTNPGVKLVECTGQRGHRL